jgi:hypothetical protein
VWKDAFVTDTSLAEAVSYLRQALGDDSQAPTYIQTVHRRGYRFVAAVLDVAAPAAAAHDETHPRVAPDVQRTVNAPAEQVRPSIANELVPWSIAIISFVAALSALWFGIGHETVARPIVKILIDLRDKQFDKRAPAIAFSPNGGRVAWSACMGTQCQLYLRDLASLWERPIPYTDGAAAPFFSPNGMWIGFFADGKLKKVFLQGGSPVTITDAAQPYGAVWMPGGKIVFAASVAGGLMQVPEQG